MKQLLVALLLLTTLPPAVLGQEAELSLYNLIANSIENNEPGWELNRKAIMPSRVVIRWITKAGRALVCVAIFTSEAQAKEALKSQVGMLETMQEQKVTKSELKNFGAEGYLLRDEGADRANILFRKGSFVAMVSGPSEAVARRFSRHVSDALPKSNKGMNAIAVQRGF